RNCEDRPDTSDGIAGRDENSARVSDRFQHARCGSGLLGAGELHPYYGVLITSLDKVLLETQFSVRRLNTSLYALITHWGNARTDSKLFFDDLCRFCQGLSF